MAPLPDISTVANNTLWPTPDPANGIRARWIANTILGVWDAYDPPGKAASLDDVNDSDGKVNNPGNRYAVKLTSRDG